MSQNEIETHDSRDNIDHTPEIDSLYESQLGRHADGEGLAFFLNALKNGTMDLAAITAALQNSEEGRHHSTATTGTTTGGTTLVTSDADRTTEIDHLYQSNLGRHGDGEGLAYFLNALKSGTMDLTAITAALQNSEEGRHYSATTTGTSTGTGTLVTSDADRTTEIDHLYQTNLGRHGDSEGLAYFLNALKSGAMDLTAITATMQNSVEGKHHLETHGTTTQYADVDASHVALVGSATVATESLF